MRVRVRARARARVRARASVHRGAHLLGCHRRGTSRATGAADGAVLEHPLLVRLGARIRVRVRVRVRIRVRV